MHEIRKHYCNASEKDAASVFKRHMEDVEDVMEERLEKGDCDYYDILPTKTLSNKVYDSLEDAKYAIEHECDYEHSFKASYKKTMTAELKSLYERGRAENRKSEEYAKAHSIHSFKSAKIACPLCGSTLNIKYVKGEQCPLCDEELRSKTTIETLNRYKQNINSLNKKIIEEEKAIKKGKKGRSEETWVLYALVTDEHI